MPGTSTPAPAVPDAGQVRQQLQRILSSDAFKRATILRRFLEHVVEHELTDGEGPLKEYSIGVDVLGRAADFDPSIDTIVRVHARRLRSRLKAYYAGPGRGDPIRIDMPKGHYSAESSWNTQPSPSQVEVSDAPPGPGRRKGDVGSGAWPKGFPAPRTSLVGRQLDIAAITDWFYGNDSRLLTLTGVGGSGKTRLALAVAATLMPAFPGGMHFISLSDVPDGGGIELAVARALKVVLQDGASASEAIIEHLVRTTEAPLLLVLDNFEHLVDASPLVGSWLDGCAHLHVLATSRVPLRIYGEAEYPVAPLGTPASDAPTSPEALRAFPAIELFEQRASAANPDFRLDNDNAGSVATLCAMLDGLPLAIELMAAHARKLSPKAILSGVVPYLDLPARNVRDVPARQRTLRSMVDWSYQTLPPPVQVLFRRLSVFAGGFTHEAAEAVGTLVDMPEINMEIGEALSRLTDANLVQPDAVGEETRYSMLVTIRAYGMESLGESGESEEVHRTLAAWCLVLAEEGNQRLTVPAREAWLARCDRERGNFHVALDAMLDHGWDAMALRLGAALNGYWERRDYLTEGNRMLGRILDRVPPESDPEAWANIAYCNGGYADLLGAHEQATTYYDTMLRMRREAGDRKGEAIGLNAVAFSDIFRADYDAALQHMQQAQVYWDALGDPGARAAGLNNLANVHMVRGEYDQARTCLQEAIEIFEARGDASSIAWCQSSLGDLARECSDYEEAEAQYRRAYQAFVADGDYWGVARTWGDMGHVAISSGDLGQAAGLFRDALQAFERLDYRRGVATTIEGCARLSVARGEHAQALLLSGAAQAVRRSVRVVVMPRVHEQVMQELAPARNAVGHEQAEKLRMQGAELLLPDAIEAAARSVAAST